MIKTQDIANALGQRLMTLSPALPVAWPNKDLPAGTPHPWLIFDHVPVSRADTTYTKDGTVSRGFVQVTVMTKIGGFATSATDIGEDIAALFPNALKLTITGGVVQIDNDPIVDQGYPDGPHWRTPVRINYMAY